MVETNDLIIFASDDTADVLFKQLPKKIYKLHKIPLIKIVEIKVEKDEINRFDVLIFTSINSIICSNKYFANKKINNKKLAFCMGKKSSELLKQNFKNVFYPKDSNDSEALLAELNHQPIQLSNKTIAIIKGLGGRKLLQQELTKKVKEVKVYNVYKRVVSLSSAHILNTLELDHKKTKMVILSSQFLEVLADAVNRNIIKPKVLKKIIELPVIVNHWRIRNKAIEYGFRNVIISDGMQNIPSILNKQYY